MQRRKVGIVLTQWCSGGDPEDNELRRLVAKSMGVVVAPEGAAMDEAEEEEEEEQDQGNQGQAVLWMRDDNKLVVEHMVLDLDGRGKEADGKVACSFPPNVVVRHATFRNVRFLEQGMKGWEFVGSLCLENCANAEGVVLPALSRKTPLEMVTLDNLADLQIFPSGDVTRSLVVERCSGIEHGGTVLRYRGNLAVRNCPDLVSMASLHMHVTGAVDVAHCAKLVNLAGNGVIEARDISVLSCDSMRVVATSVQATSLDVSDCVALQRVAGSLARIGNLHLSGCPQLRTVATSLVGADARIEHSSVTDGVVEDLVELSGELALYHASCNAREAALAEVDDDDDDDDDDDHHHRDGVGGIMPSERSDEMIVRRSFRRVPSDHQKTPAAGLVGIRVHVRRLVGHSVKLRGLALTSFSADRIILETCDIDELFPNSLEPDRHPTEIFLRNCYSLRMITRSNLHVDGRLAVDSCPCLGQLASSITCEHLELEDCGQVSEVIAEVPEALHVTGCPSITSIVMYGSRTRLIDIRDCEQLHTLVAPDMVESLNLSDAPALQYLDATTVQELSLSNLAALDTLPTILNGKLSFDEGCPLIEQALSSALAVDRKRFARLAVLRMSQCPSDLTTLGMLRRTLAELDLSHTVDITALPDDLHEMAKLNLASCFSLTHLPASLGQAKGNTVLVVTDCTSLESFPHGMHVRELHARGCKSLRAISADVKVGVVTSVDDEDGFLHVRGGSINASQCINLEHFEIGDVLGDLDLTNTGIAELHSTRVLGNLRLRRCRKLTTIHPGTVVGQHKGWTLFGGSIDCTGCTALTRFGVPRVYGNLVLNRCTALQTLDNMASLHVGCSIPDRQSHHIISREAVDELTRMRGNLSLCHCEALSRLPARVVATSNLRMTHCEALETLESTRVSVGFMQAVHTYAWYGPEMADRDHSNGILDLSFCTKLRALGKETEVFGSLLISCNLGLETLGEDTTIYHTLSVSDCARLQTVSEDLSVGTFARFSNCDSLVHLQRFKLGFTIAPSNRLGRGSLEIVDCPQFQGIAGLSEMYPWNFKGGDLLLSRCPRFEALSCHLSGVGNLFVDHCERFHVAPLHLLDEWEAKSRHRKFKRGVRGLQHVHHLENHQHQHPRDNGSGRESDQDHRRRRGSATGSILSDSSQGSVLRQLLCKPSLGFGSHEGSGNRASGSSSRGSRPAPRHIANFVATKLTAQDLEEAYERAKTGRHYRSHSDAFKIVFEQIVQVPFKAHVLELAGMHGAFSGGHEGLEGLGAPMRNDSIDEEESYADDVSADEDASTCEQQEDDCSFLLVEDSDYDFDTIPDALVFWRRVAGVKRDEAPWLEEVDACITPLYRTDVLQFFQTLCESREFQLPDRRRDLGRNLLEIFRLLVHEAAHRDVILDRIADSVGSCHDRPLLAMNNIAVVIAVAKATSDSSGDELRRLGRRVMYMEIIQRHAMRKVVTEGGFVDDVSSYLRFQTALCKQLDLPIFAQTFTFASESGVSQRDLFLALKDCELTSDEDFEAWLATWPTWQRHLRRKAADEISWGDLPASARIRREEEDQGEEFTNLLGEPLEDGVVLDGKQVVSLEDLLRHWVETGRDLVGTTRSCQDLPTLLQRFV
ncbi:E3 ubiquitin-protein ligase SlrP (RING-type E3 ubiquitin transferase SlrP) (Secreted effector protein SlrP) [Durusdinium trenchii]|uniref:E3 ubiquitin-protein ligase SlrP (RING-type E3 ubiquitin transferase SlrP) (Secreted effector protein SlrP) n=1 Tax=Durusdinium trenchii TaxID=1381693 RepID=A0ABP0SJ82_9DINO